MATYSVLSGVLICTGTGITTQGIVSAVNANSGSLNTVGGSAASATTTLTEQGYRTSTINADFEIGNGSTTSTWVAENESITVWANFIQFNNADVRFGTKNTNGTYSNPVFFSYDSTINTAGGIDERWKLINGGHFEAYGSTILTDNVLTYEATVGDVTFERCYLSCQDGMGDTSGTYGTTGNPTVKYIDCIIDSTQSSLKLYQQIDYVLDRVQVTNNQFGIQPRTNHLVLIDPKLDTNTYHSVPNLGNANVTFINSDITNLRLIYHNNSDIHRLVQRFDYQSVDSNGSALSSVLVRIIDQAGSVVVNNESTDASGRISTLPTYDGIKCLQYKTYAGTTATVRANHTFLSYRYGYGLTSKTIAVQSNVDIQEVDFKLADLSITESNKATVAAYTEIDTPAKFYDRAAAHLENNLGTFTAFLVTRSGNQIDDGAYNVTIDATATSAFAVSGNTITIKASTFTGDITTTGTITLSNGANIVGTRTDTNGTTTVTTLTLTGLQSNTEVRVFDAGTTTEVAGVENSGTTFTANLDESSVDIVLHAIGYEYQKIEGADTTSNLTLPISQRFDRNYRNP